MKVLSATVLGGRVEIPSDVARDGDLVTVLAPEPVGEVVLTRAQEEELSAASEEIRRGEFVEGDALLQELRGRVPA